MSGVRVIDFTRVLSGPYATMTLAELGADVIKVEMPAVGDETRAWGPASVNGSSAYFAAVNRGKRSVTLDLGSSEGRLAARQLVSTADVLVENFRPGVADRLGIGADEMMAAFPGLIYGSITGFGTSGPLADAAGTEVIVEAESGLMDVTGMPGAAPVRFGVAMVDIATGLALSTGVCAALAERARTGVGRRVDTSLFATAVSSLGTLIAGSAADGTTPDRWGSGHPTIVPYRAFEVVDGFVVLGATNDAMFTRLVGGLGIDPAEIDAAWSTNAGRINARTDVETVIHRSISHRCAGDVVTVLRDHGVLVAEVASAADTASGEQALALSLFEHHDGIPFSRSPLSGSDTRPLWRAPQLGEHTAEVFAELNRGADCASAAAQNRKG
nr:CoA transferase [Gordonia humi]